MAVEFLDFIFALSVVIVAAKAGGYVSIRLGQPSVLGELLAGVILGPTALDMLHLWPVFHFAEEIEEALKMMAELGVIMLMLLAGLELHLEDLVRSGRVSALAGILGVFIPLGLGYGTSLLFGMDGVGALFMALTLAATSVSISAQTLMELNVLHSRVGLALLGAAVFDDIFVILILSISIALVGGAAAGLVSVGITVLGMVAYLALAIAAGFWVLPRLIRAADRLPVSRGALAFTIVACLLYAWAAEVLGSMAAITGAFLTGLFIARTPLRGKVEEGVSTLAYGFFVPIFFVDIGLEVNMRDIGGSAIWFAIAITLIAIISKVAGSGLGGLLGGFNKKESLQLGVGMISRGEVGLIVASFSLSANYLRPQDFSVAVFMVILATLVTPPLLRAVFAEEDRPAKAPVSRPEEV